MAMLLGSGKLLDELGCEGLRKGMTEKVGRHEKSAAGEIEGTTMVTTQRSLMIVNLIWHSSQLEKEV